MTRAAQSWSHTSLPLPLVIAEYLGDDGRRLPVVFADIRISRLDEVISMRRSVRRFGVVDPVELGTDGRVRDGVLRLCVAVELCLSTVPVVYVP